MLQAVQVNTPTPFSSNGMAKRSFFADLWNAENIALEDYERSLEQDRLNRDFNAEEAQKQRDFEERMSNTAYQRAVDDMKKAGINPILAFSQGGASTPSGASASSSGGSSVKGVTSDSSVLINGLLSIVAGLITKVPPAKMLQENDSARRILSSMRERY